MSIPQFGYRQMNSLTFDHPSDNLNGFARIGRKEIVTYTTEGEGEWGGTLGQGVRCRSYQLTRIKSWKVGYWVYRHIIQLVSYYLVTFVLRRAERNG